MKTVLIIEDNDMVRENTAEILELANYRVLTAANGKLGVELALRDKPDIVVCDIAMPVMDGYAVLHVFNINPELETIPFVFLSAKTERSEIRKGMENGADDYITKPFEECELLSAIAGRLRKAEVMKKESKSFIPIQQDIPESSQQIKTLEELVKDKKVYAYKKKQILYTEGNEATRLFFVHSGKVKTFRTNANGKELITGIYKEGDFFGYLPLIEETDYQDSAESLEDSEISFIPKPDFLTLLNQNQTIAKRFLKMMAISLLEKEKSLSGMAYNSLRKRTADSLLFLDTKYQVNANSHVPMQINRDDIAGIVGSSTESLIRTLSDFKSEHLIDIVEGKILILNEQKLQHLPN